MIKSKSVIFLEDVSLTNTCVYNFRTGYIDFNYDGYQARNMEFQVRE